MIEKQGGQRASASQNIRTQVRLFGCLRFRGATDNSMIDSAASAVRNLNDYEIMNRKLRVDFSNDGGDDESVSYIQQQQIQSFKLTDQQQSAPANYQHTPLPSNGLSNLPASQSNSSLPPLPTGVDLPPGLTCPDAISRTLNTLPPAQLLDVLSQMKTLTTTDPGKATELLQQAPQLSYAIFQALLLMGLVSTDALSSVVEAAAAQPAPPQGYGAPPQGTYPPGFPPPPPHMSGQLGIPMGTAPVQGHVSYPPPPMQHRAPAAQQPAPQAVPDSDALMQQVLAMPQELIDSLPPADRAQLMALRASYGR